MLPSSRATSPSAERLRESDRCKQGLVDADAPNADLLRKPDFDYWVSLSRELRKRAISPGYRQRMTQAGALRALHAG